MSMRSCSSVSSTLALILGSLVGCGGDDLSRIKLVPVKGTVTYDGKPLAGASLTFTPDSENADSTPGSAVTGPDGNYTAMFYGREGLAPGNYTVAVAKTLL